VVRHHLREAPFGLLSAIGARHLFQGPFPFLVAPTQATHRVLGTEELAILLNFSHRPTQMAQWLHEARQGSEEALGRLLDSCRQYLLLVANRELHSPLQAKFGPSDLVQDTFLKAHCRFERFAGTTEAELLAWLRRILLNNAANAARSFLGTAGRNLDREVSLDYQAGSERLVTRLAAPGDTPSAQMMGAEQSEALQRGLAQLPEQYRQIIVKRSLEERSFEEISLEIGKSEEAARKLWGRAVEQLQAVLRGQNEHGENTSTGCGIQRAPGGLRCGTGQRRGCR
jgi:RNA polymerase sigma-70 factor, ECF subfamily